MSISLSRLTPRRVNVIRITGRVSDDELIRFFSGIDPAEPLNRAPWIAYLDDDADLSGTTFGAWIRLKEILFPKVSVLAESAEYCGILISNSPTGEIVADFWEGFVGRAKEWPMYPIFFSDLKGACEWLELPAEEHQAAFRAVDEAWAA